MRWECEPWEGSAVSRSPVKTEDSDDVSWKEGRKGG